MPSLGRDPFLPITRTLARNYAGATHLAIRPVRSGGVRNPPRLGWTDINPTPSKEAAVISARRIPRPSAALVVSFAALFAAMSGTGYAALKITGKSVANNTLTGLDVKNRSLGAQEHKKNSLGGDQINESLLGTVPHAAKATDADTLGGSPASAFMAKTTRAFEAPIPAADNIANNAVVGTLADLQPGTYVVTAKLTYDNDGNVVEQTCTLHLPGGNDTTTFTTDTTDMETLTLQKVTNSNAVFSPSVSCTSDGGNEDIVGNGNIIAIRVD
jgi:hypothetical protein